MFFVLSKIAGFFALPSNLIATLLTLAAILLITGRRRIGSALSVMAVVLLLVAGYSPLSTVLMLTLSERFPPWQPGGPDPDGIIVLGGGIDSGPAKARGTAELNGSAERVVAMLQLARQFPHARIVYSGGSSSLFPHGVAEAPIAARLLDSFGVPPDRIILEERSRTTNENAIFVRDMIAPKPGERWLLVTSAYHMPRAVAVFRAAGLDVEPYPVDWRTRGWIDAIRPFDELSEGLSRSDIVAHEWTGLLMYWLSGRSKDLLPHP
jgi:uncharacterized SAM-binding protein YcdF (DUF218 family)